MSSTIFLALIILLAGGIISAFMKIKWIGPLFAVAGSALAGICASFSIFSGYSWQHSFSWQIPIGSLCFGMDSLSAFFVILIASIGALAAIYGHGYLNKEKEGRKVAASWCWYNLLLASMIIVVIARDGFLFLVAWECMSLTSFLLVMFDNEKPEVMKAGWIYLATTHIGTAFLLAMFILMGGSSGLAFSDMHIEASMSSFIFLAALIGFGTKAGFLPLHIWLPEAHPAAPSHVSALMSGVMIKLGIYGLLRVILLIGHVEIWWGWTLIVIGALSGVLGVLFALAQHDIKRLLAYHSVENIGIIAMGIGIGILGAASKNSDIAALGFCGGLLHVLNHGVFKSLLFMGAGSIIHAAGTREIDRMGGLIKKMPVTAATFLIGAAAICALPPLNGFVSEFLVYSAAFKSIGSGTHLWSSLLLISSLALIGGLAAACFTKAFGVMFLGEPRSESVSEAKESPRSMRLSMICLATICFVMGIGAPFTTRLVYSSVVQLAPFTLKNDALIDMFYLLGSISICAAFLAATIAVFERLRKHLSQKRKCRETVTWDCGYTAPSASMQYTASSFADPIVGMFRPVLRTDKKIQEPDGYFPETASLHSHTDDVFVKSAYWPAVKAVISIAGAFRSLQRGRTHLYILYIFVTVMVLLAWNLK